MNINYYLYFSKRFYTPPSRRTWSKQNPKFLTPRPLVHPYNLNRLHPEKEWWKLSNRKLHPITFMGHPDPIYNDKIGGSIYAEQMDSSTLAIFMYRCLSKDINNVYIWDKLIAQAKKLCIKMNSNTLSYIFLYSSKFNIIDSHFITSFIGRINALLTEFSLIDSANVINAMQNPHYFHKSTMDKLIKQANNLLLARSDINVRDTIAFLSCYPYHNPEFLDYELLQLIFDEIHVHIIDLVDKSLLLSALSTCYELGLLTRYLHNYCKLPIEKMVNQLIQGDFIDNVGLYSHLVKVVYLFNFGSLSERLYKFIESKAFLLNGDEVSVLLWASSWDSQFPKSLVKILIDMFTKFQMTDSNFVLGLHGFLAINSPKIPNFDPNIDNLDTNYKLLFLSLLNQFNYKYDKIDELIAKIKPTLPWHVCKLYELVSQPSHNINLLDSPLYNLNHHDLVSLLKGVKSEDGISDQIRQIVSGIINGELNAIKCSHTLLALSLKVIKDEYLIYQILDKFSSLKWDSNLETYESFKNYRAYVTDAMNRLGVKNIKIIQKCKD